MYSVALKSLFHNFEKRMPKIIRQYFKILIADYLLFCTVQSHVQIVKCHQPQWHANMNNTTVLATSHYTRPMQFHTLHMINEQFVKKLYP